MPFRIPALGTQETRIYVLLLLIEGIVGAEHAGFQTLLTAAKEALNRPWLGAGLTQAQVQAVDPAKRETSSRPITPDHSHEAVDGAVRPLEQY